MNTIKTTFATGRTAVASIAAGVALVSVSVGVSSATADLKHHWPLDGDIVDVITNTGASVTGPVEFVDSPVPCMGQAIRLYGDTCIDSNVAPQARAGEPISYAVWAQLPTAAPSDTMDIFGFEATHSTEMRLLLDVNGRLRASFRDDSWNDNVATMTNPPLDGAMHHVVSIRDGLGSIFIYVDGVLGAVGTDDGGDINVSNRLDLGIGVDLHKTSGCIAKFSGMIDDLRVYDHALTDDEILALAAPCPLTLDNPRFGKAGEFNTFRVSDCIVGSWVTVYYGFRTGATSLFGCPIELGIDNAIKVGGAVANVDGLADITAFVPSAAAGRTIYFQAYQQDDCSISNVVKYRWP